MPAAPKWVPSAPPLIAQPESDAIDLDDSGTLTQTFKGKYADCKAGALFKGTAGSGDTAGLLVKKCSVRRERGQIGILTIEWGGYTGGDPEDPKLPADTFSLQPIEQNPNLETLPVFDDVTADQELISLARQAGLVANKDESLKAFSDLLDLGTSGAANATALALLLASGHTNFYEAALRYQWTSFSIAEPTVTRGGYINTPTGPLATLIAGLSLSCLREADALDFENGFYKLTKSWVCGPAGKWSTEIYDTI